MPQFMVTSPDGRKFRVNAPEGATQQDAIAYIQRQQMQQAPALSGEDTQFLKDQGLTEEEIQAQARIRSQSPGQGVIPEQRAPGIGPRAPQGFTPDPSVAAIEAEADAQPRTLGGQLARDVPRTARGMAQGASFGTSDEALAGLRSLGGENYGQALANERAELGKLGPARLPAEIVGSLPLGLAAGGRVAAAKTLGGRVGQGALMGGGMGAAYGFGSGEGGLGNRLESALLAGGTGAVLGAGIPLGTAGVAKGAQVVSDRVAPFVRRIFSGAEGAKASFKDQAARKVAETIMQQFPDMAPEQAVRNAQRIVQRYGPKAALMDAGELTRRLAGDIARQGGAPRVQIERFVRGRQEGELAPSGQVRGGQYERVGNILDEAAEGQQSGLAAQRSLKAQQGRASKPLYEQTANNPENLIPDEQFAPLGTDPYVAEQIGKVKASKLHGLADLQDNSMPVIDAAQKRMSDAASKAYRKGATHEGNLISEKRRALVEAADEAFPDYAKAREVWRDFKGVMDADDLGRKFMRGDVDVLEDAVKRMSPTEKGQFRAGVVRALKDLSGKTPSGGDISNRLLRTPEIRERVRIAFDTPRSFRKYIKGMIGEKELFKTYAEITRGSPTAERLATMQKTGVDTGDMAGAALDAATGNNVGLAYRALRALKPRGILGPPEPVRQGMAGLLTGQDIEPLLKAAQIASGGTLNRRALEQALLAAQASGTGRGLLP